MPVCENIKSLICNPTEKCCQKLCRKRKRETDDDDGEYHSTLKTLVDKMTPSRHTKKPSKQRKPTGWAPPRGQNMDEDTELSDDDPNEKKWTKKEQMAFPLIITSTATFNESDVNDPVKSVWGNKDSTVFSAMTASNAKPSRYWVKSNIQYVVVLPVQKRHRSSPPPPTMSNSVSVDENPRSITEKTFYDDDEPPPITKKTIYDDDEPPPLTKKPVNDDEELPPTRRTYFADPPEQKNKSRKGTFDSEDFSFDSESDDSFEPRSKAKPSKKKGGCCGKRQDSDDS